MWQWETIEQINPGPASLREQGRDRNLSCQCPPGMKGAIIGAGEVGGKIDETKEKTRTRSKNVICGQSARW